MKTQLSSDLDVLLVQPPVRDFYLTSKRTLPYGLISIAAAIRQAGFRVGLFDALATSKSRPEELPAELNYLGRFYGQPDTSPFSLFHQFKRYGHSFEHLSKTAVESGAPIIGISSLFTAYCREALETASLVKKAAPDRLIVMGGHHPTMFPEDVMRNPDVDFVIRGEAEEAFPLLIGKLRAGESLESVPGIVFRKSDGGLFIDSPAVVKDPGRFPVPAFDLVKSSHYRRGRRHSAVVVAARGCPMKCSYCCVANSSAFYRRKSVERVMLEIETAVGGDGPGFIDFEDENISLNREWFRELLLEIVNRYGGREIELRAMNGLFPPSLDKEMIGLMKRAGFKTLNLSVGSMSPDRLKKFNRPDVTACLDRVISDARKHGLDSVCYIIAGAPGQTAEESLSDLIRLAKRPALIGLSIFYPAPGSLDFKRLEKKGLLPDSYSMMRSSALPCPEGVSRVEAATLLRLSRIINFMKMLAGTGLRPPEPSGRLEDTMDPGLDRIRVGRKLVSWFLFDGGIRGVKPDGEIYEHEISTRLTREFIERFS